MATRVVQRPIEGGRGPLMLNGGLAPAYGVVLVLGHVLLDGGSVRVHYLILESLKFLL